jgi:uncharacterized damage-inducible protein DinB
MSTIAILWELFQHMEWADACVWKSVFGSPAARSDSTVRTRLYHLHMVHWAFLQVWLDQSLPEIPEQSTFTDIVALASWGQETHGKTLQYVGQMDKTELQRIVKIPWLDDFEKYFGKPAAPTNLIQTMLHVTSHSSHHRGQVNTRLREIGTPPPYIDFILWQCLGRPAAEWLSSQPAESR